MLLPILAGIGALCMTNPPKRRKTRKSRRRNPKLNTRTGPPRATRAPDYMYHSRTPAEKRTLWVVAGTAYGYLHNTAGEVRTWKSRSCAAKIAKSLG